MNEIALKLWQTLHHKVVRGAILTDEEQAAYDAGLCELDAEEEAQLRNSSIEQMRQMRARIAEAEAEQQTLLAQHAQLKARIVALEANLDAETRQLLGIGN